MYKVDLNSDLGESFGRYTIGNDDKIIPLISSANIACGFHASDPVVMTTAIEQTKAAGIQIGAHPGFPDLMGFGRRIWPFLRQKQKLILCIRSALLEVCAKPTICACST